MNFTNYSTDANASTWLDRLDTVCVCVRPFDHTHYAYIRVHPSVKCSRARVFVHRLAVTEYLHLGKIHWDTHTQTMPHEHICVFCSVHFPESRVYSPNQTDWLDSLRKYVGTFARSLTHSFAYIVFDAFAIQIKRCACKTQVWMSNARVLDNLCNRIGWLIIEFGIAHRFAVRVVFFLLFLSLTEWMRASATRHTHTGHVTIRIRLCFRAHSIHRWHLHGNR